MTNFTCLYTFFFSFSKVFYSKASQHHLAVRKNGWYLPFCAHPTPSSRGRSWTIWPELLLMIIIQIIIRFWLFFHLLSLTLYLTMTQEGCPNIWALKTACCLTGSLSLLGSSQWIQFFSRSFYVPPIARNGRLIKTDMIASNCFEPWEMPLCF